MENLRNKLLNKGIIGTGENGFTRNLEAMCEWGYVISDSGADVTTFGYSLYDYNHNLITEYSGDSPLRIVNGYLAVNDGGTCRLLYNLNLGSPICSDDVKVVYHKSTCKDDSPFDMVEECVVILEDKSYYYRNGYITKCNVAHETLIRNGFYVMTSNQDVYVAFVRNAIIHNGIDGVLLK